MIGISASALQKIESESLRMSPKVVSRITALTHVDPACLRNLRGGKLKSVRGKVFTAAEFQALQHRPSSAAMQHECDYMVLEIGRRIKVLLEAASSRGRFDLVLSDLWSSLDEIRNAFGLKLVTKTRLHRDGGEYRSEWQDICPPETAVFFDDSGFYLYPSDMTAGRINAGLRARGQKAMYGKSNDGFLFTIREALGTAASTECSANASKRGSSARNRQIKRRHLVAQ